MTEPLKLTVEQAIDRLGIGKFQDRLLWSSGLCNASDSIEVILLSFLMVAAQKEFGVGTHYGSLLTSVVFLGAMMGTLALGFAGDRFGRKPMFLTSCAIISISGMLTAASPNYWTMVVLRFGVGFGLGGIVIPYDTLSEFMPSAYRGNYMMRLGFFWCLGTMAVPGLAYFGLEHQQSWRLFVLLCSIPCVLSAILAAMWVPESPRWLISQGKADKALDILRKGAVLNGKDPLETFPEGIHFIRDPLEEEDQVHSISHLFEKEWRGLTFSLWGVWIGKSFMYWGTVQIITLVFSGQSTEGGLPTYDFDYTAIFLSSLAECFGCGLTILFIDWTGRKVTQSVFYILGGLFVFAMCWIASQSNQGNRAAMIAFAFLARMCVMAAAQLTWLITAEIIPTQIRTTGHALASAVARIGGASTPWLASSDNSFQTIAIIMAIIGLYTGAMVCTLPETKGRSLGTARMSSMGPDNTEVSEIV